MNRRQKKQLGLAGLFVVLLILWFLNLAGESVKS